MAYRREDARLRREAELLEEELLETQRRSREAGARSAEHEITRSRVSGDEWWVGDHWSGWDGMD